MPDLEQAAVTVWLAALRPAAATEWPPPIRAIETEGDNAERLQALGAILDELVPAQLRGLSIALSEPPLRDEVRAVMAQLGAARLMRLLHWLAEIDLPDCPTVIHTLVGGDDGNGEALRAAVAVVTSRAVLRRIFALDRIAALHAACQIALEGDA
jgi:hypothetical protein